MPTRSRPWIVTGTDGKNPGECLRCGAKMNIPLPQNLTVWCAAAAAFVKVHSKCKETTR